MHLFGVLFYFISWKYQLLIVYGVSINDFEQVLAGLFTDG